jgi:hypothetical protein
MLKEFNAYLDRNKHLPNWKYLLDVVNCATTMHEVEEGVYCCPNTGGAYSHKRAKYFGPYSNKRVGNIFEIDGLVVVEKGGGGEQVQWRNSEEISDAELLMRAQNFISKHRHIEVQSHSLQVFLLSGKAATNFFKDSSGGMWQSKKYFEGIASDCPSSAALGRKLMDRAWGDFL